MISGVNIISGKASVVSVNRGGGVRGLSVLLIWVLGGIAPQENFQVLKSI